MPTTSKAGKGGRPSYSQMPSSSSSFPSMAAAVGSTRTLDSVSSCGTSLQPIGPKRAIKVVLIGDGGAGKTSLRNHFLTGQFSASYRATIGADFITKTIPVDPSHPDGEKATLQIWDTAGQERFQSLGSAFYRGADAVIIAFDIAKVEPVDGASSLDKVVSWYNAFMEKAPGPSNEDDRKRFCWVCAANKVDLVDQYSLPKVPRSQVRAVLDSLVPAPKDQPDWGIDQGQDGVRPTGAKEPAKPEDVLARPDPNTSPTPTKTGANLSTAETPNGTITMRDLKTNKGKSRNALASQNGNANGTVTTVYETPFNTMSMAPTLTASPPASEHTLKLHSGFLSNLMSKSTAKDARDKSIHARTTKGHQKRQSIKSIKVFQPPEDSGSSTASAAATSSASASGRYGFPGSTETPPRQWLSGKERQRVDSTMSLGAPSVYHTPRSSTILSVSPTPRTTSALPASAESEEEDQAEPVHGGGQGKDAAGSQLAPSSASNSISAQTAPTPMLRHKVSTSSAATAKVNGRTLKAPKSINDLFQPATEPATPNAGRNGGSVSPAPTARPFAIPNNKVQNASPPPTPPATQSRKGKHNISKISDLPEDNKDETEGEGEERRQLPNSIEQGFTLFYTSAKTGQNLERMFQHIVTRVVASEQFAKSFSTAEDAEEEAKRKAAQDEIVRRTIRLASGKNPDKKWGCC